MTSPTAHFSIRNKGPEPIVVRSTAFSPFPLSLREQHVPAYSEAQIDTNMRFEQWWYTVGIYSSQDGRKLAEKSLVCENSALVFLQSSTGSYVLE